MEWSVLLGLMATDIAGIAQDNHDTSIDAISDAAEPPPLGIGFHRSRRKGKGAERDSEAEDQKAVLKNEGKLPETWETLAWAAFLIKFTCPASAVGR